MSNLPYIEDPRIAQVAKMCCDEMLADIGELMAKGEDFFHARECVMAERGNIIAARYGKEVATRALQAVKATAPTDMPSEIMFKQDQVIADARIKAANYVNGGEHYWTPTQLWKQKNFDAFFDVIQYAATLVVASPFVGAAGVIVLGGFSYWWPVTYWTAIIGLSVFPILFFATCFIPNTPTPVFGSKPKTGDEIAKQREMMDIVRHNQHMQSLTAQGMAEDAEKQKKKDERDHVRRLKLIADDLEISAWQERGRLGTSLPGDPIYIPKATREPRTYRRRKAK